MLFTIISTGSLRAPSIVRKGKVGRKLEKGRIIQMSVKYLHRFIEKRRWR